MVEMVLYGRKPTFEEGREIFTSHEMNKAENRYIQTV